jgi:hypothetical protein
MAAAPATSVVCFGARFQNLIRQERVFVYLEQRKITSYAAMMETFQMKKHRDSIFIRPFPQRLDSSRQPKSGSHIIESTYAQLL